MENIKARLRSFKRGLKEFHTKKPQLEFFTVLLTIPMLLTVLALNINNLKGGSSKEAPKSETIVITQGPSNNGGQDKEIIVTKEACKAGIGDISIAFPDEGERVDDNPVNIDIDYQQGEYCEVVWSYRINEGPWSQYDDRSIALYNLPPGDIKFDLRVKSLVNSDQKNLTRRFVYTGSVTSTPSTTPSPSPTQTQ